MSGPGYIIPGHQSPIGSWPLDQLQAARRELAADREAGFLPAGVDQAIDALSAEISRREQGGAREVSRDVDGIGRALERWFDVRPELLPMVRGVDAGAQPGGGLFDGAQRSQESARAPERSQALEQAALVDLMPERAAAFDPSGMARGGERGRGADREIELEP
ncbi:MAG: hypothetical protein ACOYM8_11110, partial [Caulobacterales bacterium]